MINTSSFILRMINISDENLEKIKHVYFMFINCFKRSSEKSDCNK